MYRRFDKLCEASNITKVSNEKFILPNSSIYKKPENVYMLNENNKFDYGDNNFIERIIESSLDRRFSQQSQYGTENLEESNITPENFTENYTAKCKSNLQEGGRGVCGSSCNKCVSEIEGVTTMDYTSRMPYNNYPICNKENSSSSAVPTHLRCGCSQS